jgi:hypothetical protein
MGISVLVCCIFYCASCFLLAILDFELGSGGVSMLLLGVDIHGMDIESKNRDMNRRIRSGSGSTGIGERGTGKTE